MNGRYLISRQQEPPTSAPTEIRPRVAFQRLCKGAVFSEPWGVTGDGVVREEGGGKREGGGKKREGSFTALRGNQVMLLRCM